MDPGNSWITTKTEVEELTDAILTGSILSGNAGCRVNSGL